MAKRGRLCVVGSARPISARGGGAEGVARERTAKAEVSNTAASSLPELPVYFGAYVRTSNRKLNFFFLSSRLTGEEGKEFAAQVGKHFPQLCKIFKTHIPTENSELSSAALQALGFCAFNSKIASLLCETEIQELLSVVNSVAVKAVDKNTRTRALWVISKQAFPADIIGKLVPSIITTLETVLNKGDLHSMVVEYEALNVIIRLIEQAPSPMEEQAVRWAKLIIPLVVHSAHKVQLRGATALEMGVPLLLQKQPEVAAITEELMTTKIIPELQKLFSSKNETYVLKLWPLFVKLLGKALHRSGSFINSLLQLEELGFRSGSPVVKKIAFIAWKSLIDNFALNPEILCSAKRLKLLMQPLSSIHVRTEALALTKLEVWWYLLMRLGPQLPAHFEQVCVPLIQSTLSIEASFLPGNSSRLSINQSLVTPGSAQKSGTSTCPRLKLNSNIGGVLAIPSIQLLGIEMLLHFFMGPEVLNFAKENSIVLSLEPLQYSVISSPSFFCKHASTFINAVQDGFIAIGKDASDIILSAIWKKMIEFVKAAIESGSKKERQSSEILTMLLQALKNIVLSNELPVLMSLSLIEITIKELPPKVLGSPAYQVANMDLLNLSFREDLLKCCVQEERFFLNYESLVGFILSGPTSPLAFSESVFTIVNQSAQYLENKEHIWRIWSTVVNPLTEWINQTNEVNQGDALEHNFSAIYSALLLPIKHIFPSSEFPQPTLKTLLRSWSELYRAFARCALLVATAEDNLCCEELCAKIISGIEDETQINQSMLDGLSHITSVMVDCINFAPYDTKYQSSNRSPQTPTDWSKKKKDDPLGRLSSLVKLLMILINTLHILASKESGLEKLAPVGASVIGSLQNIISHISLPSLVRSLFKIVTKPLAVFYEKTKSTNVSKVTNGLNNKIEKLLVESISCLQSHYTEAFDSELLQELSPILCIMLLNKSKQIRTQAAQFWNATFGKAIMLTYPEELKSVLHQARQNTILSLPGFESTEMAGEFNGTYSDSTENSQWDTVISGIDVNPSGKRDSLLAQTNELKENSINPHITPVKMKLEFSQLKTNRKNMLLEEENTVDFVFIPPETKERVLTEHQKEILRTKRVDIPTMYNNLDASQDTALFSQYSQSEEDSADKATLVDVEDEHGKNEDITITQDEKVASDLPVIPCKVTEKCKTDVLPEKTTLTTTEQHDKKNLAPNCKESKIGATKTVSGDPDVSLSENISDVSSTSSASSDVISGTPQPVSRRQSFITLEKFDSSNARPFSPSTFSNTSGPSGSIPLSDKQESMISSNDSSKGKSAVENSDTIKVKKEEGRLRTKRSCLEIIDALENYVKVKKAKDENKLNSKLLAESTVGIKRSSLRQNKTELLEDKKTKLAQPDQEKNIVLAVTTQVEEKHELLGEAQEAGYLVDIQSQASSLNVTGNIMTENKQTLDNVSETKAGQNVDSKENTPPVIDISGEAISNLSQTTQISSNQKPLRRSLRRKSETIEGPVDSQDKEHNQQKKDGQKDDERFLLKKAPQVKETISHKQKSMPEKTIDTQRDIHESNAIEGIITDECHTSRNSQEEDSKSTGKSESNNSASDIDEVQDSAPDAAAEKAKEIPRYHTRSSSQGLLTSIENSESDNSEIREEGTKRKRSGRPKNKISPLGNHIKEDMENQDVHSNGPVEIQKVSVENKEIVLSEGHMSVPLVSDNSEEGDKNTLQDSEHLEHKENMDTPVYIEISHPEKISDKMPTETSLESKLGTRILDTDSVASCSTSNFTDVSGDSAYGTVVASGSSEKAEMPECLHKRSKRTRKSKSCDCCDEKSSVQLEQSTADLKKVGTPESKLKEHKKVPSKAATASPSVPAEESQSAERLTVVPCATSTPLLFSKDFADLKDSRRDIESDRHLPEVEAPKEEPNNLPCIKSEVDRPVAESLGCVDLAEEASEPCSADSHSKESIAQCPSEVDTDPPAVKKVVSNQSDELEEAGIDVDHPEDKPSSETVTSVVQNAVEDATVACVMELPEPQETEVGQEENAEETEVGQEENAESAIADTLVGYQTSVLVQKGSSNSNSPLKSKELDAFSLAKMSESPNGVQARCVWSPSASPSTSILKRGVKRQQEEDSPSPANKSRRVSFANPIYQEELADDIDRRSPMVRIHSCNGSQTFQSVKPSPSSQAKITEMVKEPLPAPSESIYPALTGCKAPVDTILPQITSNIWARGLGQLIRAKNIRTVGDLSSLSAAEIKTLPIRSPKVSNVRRALKGYHEQQIKSHGLAETADQDDTEKFVNGIDEKPFSMNDDKAVAGEPVALRADDQSTIDLWAQINTLAAQMTSENLLSYSGNELFEMQEKLHSMTNCIMKNLQSRWKSSSHESPV
ncbi:hypothetical protein JD844_022632 [Phrynosoma platyrhinos]|uniref:Telomere-associated protein Rif1 N-terminal domain-containing protein n=1 Tax=Phrynosoma platyrhinos TaxID=52577 RepID=A0ABQ7SVV5_PHRPL|nr:hypothetical protein JD844_022632 [Phrynosoma platyrhinos]